MCFGGQTWADLVCHPRLTAARHLDERSYNHARPVSPSADTYIKYLTYV